MIPIVPIPKSKNGKYKLPEGKMVMLLGEEGLHKLVRNNFYTTVTKLDKAGHLGKVEEVLDLTTNEIPVHMIKAPEDEKQGIVLPEDPICYLVGANGVFLQIKNEDYYIITECKKIDTLAKVKTQAWPHVEKIPLKLFQQIVSFFKAVYEKHKAEAVVLLYYNPTKKVWGVQAPEQKVSSAHVDYDITDMEPPEGFGRQHMFGSIHSHAAMGASHSAVDDSDEFKFDGPHITVGNLNQVTHTYSCRWMLAGAEFKLALEGIVDGIEEDTKPDPTWLEQVSEKTYVVTHQGRTTHHGHHGGAGFHEGQFGHYSEDFEAGGGVRQGAAQGGGSITSTRGNTGKNQQTPETKTTTGKNGVATDRPENGDHYPLGAETVVESQKDLLDFDALEAAVKTGHLTQEEADIMAEDMMGFQVREHP